MTQVRAQPKPDWAPLPRPGCHGVEFRVLLGVDGIFIANLRFAQDATIDEHDAPFEIDVICLAGFLFLGNPLALPCDGTIPAGPSDTALEDFNGDGIIDISDVIGKAGFLFLGGPAHPLGRVCTNIPGCPVICP